MVDTLSKEDRTKTMKAIKGQNTSIERKLWAVLAGMGVSGWKKNYKGVLGKPDVVFLENKIAIFINGCFWHSCPICNRPMPETNHDYWKRKIQKNQSRDKEIINSLITDGWQVIIIWEHEIHGNPPYTNIKNKLDFLRI